MNKNCPVYQVMLFAGKRWTILILTELYRGSKKWKRYSRIKDELPNVTPKMLSSRLKDLEKEGMIRKRIDTKKFPIKTEYSLTNKGEGFVEIIKKMRTWGLKWKIKNEYCEKVDCKHCEI